MSDDPTHHPNGSGSDAPDGDLRGHATMSVQVDWRDEEKDISLGARVCRALRTIGKGLKAAAPVVLPAFSLLVAVVALWLSNQANDRAEKRVAPVLIPGTPLKSRGEVRPYWMTFGDSPVIKRADRMVVVDAGPKTRLVVPMRNGGDGEAMVVGMARVVDNCDTSRRASPPTTNGR